MKPENETPLPPNRYYLELGAVPESIRFVDVWQVIVENKFKILLCIVLFEALFLKLALGVTTKYKAEVVVAEAHPISMIDPTADASLNLEVDVAANEALAMLSSRDFLSKFIQENNLIPILFAEEWDPDAQAWLEEEPTLLQGFKRFKNSVQEVSKDANTDLTLVSITWVDPELAAKWANQLIYRVNEVTRLRTIEEAMRTIEILSEELQHTASLEIKSSLNELLKAQKAKIVAAKVHKEFAYRIIDPAVVPEDPVAPQLPIMLIAMGFIVGVFTGVSLAFINSLMFKKDSVKED